MLEHFKFLELNRNIDTAIQAQYDYGQVFLSVALAVFSSYIAFLVARRIRNTTTKKYNSLWLWTGTLTLGSGIWAMHFVGMLAYKLPGVVTYDITLTIVSVIPAIFSSWIILKATDYNNKAFQYILWRSILIGSGIGFMHYIGMSGMFVNGSMRYDPWLFLLSIVVAIVLGGIALWFKLQADRYESDTILSIKLLVSAVIMGFAISAMHYVGMAAMYVFPNGNDRLLISGSWSPDDLVKIISVVILLFGLILLAVIEISNQLDLHKKMESPEENSVITLNSVSKTVITTGLGRTLFLRFLLVSILPLMMVTWISVENSTHTIDAQSIKALSAVNHAKHHNITDYFNEIITNLQLEAELNSTVELLVTLKSAYKKSGKTLKTFTRSYMWAVIENELATDLSYFRRNYSYLDVLLLDEKGNILYSIRKDSDLGTNLFDGEYAKSKFSAAAQASYKIGISVYSDLEYYVPYDNQITSYLTQVVLDEHGDKIGVMAIQIEHTHLMVILADHGKDYTKIYLVGEDLLMRSEVLTGSQSSLLQIKVETMAVADWDKLETEKEHGDISRSSHGYKDYRGITVLGSSIPIEFAGVKMLLVAEIDEEVALLPIEDLVSQILVVFLITIVLALIFSIYSVRAITAPILQLTLWARQLAKGVLVKQDIQTPDNEIGVLNEAFVSVVDSLHSVSKTLVQLSEGDLSQAIVPRSKNDVLVVTLNQLRDAMKGVVTQADAIAQGNYDVDIQLRSDKDALGMALRIMTQNLRDAEQQSEKQNWLNTSRAALAEILSGGQDATVLANKVVTYLTKCLGAQVGVFYTIEPQADTQTLKFAAGYAYERNAQLQDTVMFGESLVGQAAQEQEIILLSDLPEDYLHVNSALGKSLPSHLLVAPFMSNKQVQCVIEMGRFGQFTDDHLAFLRIVSGPVAIAFDACFQIKQTKELLLETRNQSEELQTQQEELRATNESLEEQTQELKASEEELTAQSEELRASNEELAEKTHNLTLASKYKSEFMANMSHELRTPLNSFLLLSKDLSDNKKGNLDAEQLEDLAIIHEGGMDLLHLINDIMDLSKVEAGKLDVQNISVDLDATCRNLSSLFTVIAKAKALEFTLVRNDKTPSTILSDPQRLEQILKNFLSNAFKFTSTGSVQVKIHLPAASTQFLGSLLSPKTAIAFSVMDTGIGISADKQKEIFEAFQQEDGSTSRKYGGTGLGLTISRKLAKLLGGEIQLVSTQGVGSTFTLYLPLSSNESQMDEDIQVTGHVPQVTETVIRQSPLEPSNNQQFFTDDRYTISKDDHVLLIIEDDANFAKVLLNIVRNHGYKGLVAGDGRSGLYLALDYQPKGILLDLGLPDMHGSRVLEQLKFHLTTKHIPVHVITGLEQAHDALQQGAIGLLRKPANEEDIDRAIFDMEKITSADIKTALIVEDNKGNQRAISALISNKGIQTECVGTGKAAIEKITSGHYDCVILDIGLPDISGFEVLESLSKNTSIHMPPILVYTGQELSTEERNILQKYSATIVLKDAESPEKLLDEALLFMHSLMKDLSASQKKTIDHFHDESILLRGRKILLVDDDMRNTFALSKRLQAFGLLVVEADNGQSALNKLKKLDDIELILMDIMMPIMDGYEAMRQIRQDQRYKKVPILALTAKAMKEDREKCIEAGASDYLTKPVDIDKLLSMLKVWLYRK